MPSTPKTPEPTPEPTKTADQSLADALTSLRGTGGPLFDPAVYDVEDLADAVMDALDRDGFTIAPLGS